MIKCKNWLDCPMCYDFCCRECSGCESCNSWCALEPNDCGYTIIVENETVEKVEKENKE